MPDIPAALDRRKPRVEPTRADNQHVQGLDKLAAEAPKPKSWRDLIKVHPAADIPKMMSREELLALGQDILENGLKVPIVFWSEMTMYKDGLTVTWIDWKDAQWFLLDGRNRLEAMELVGL